MVEVEGSVWRALVRMVSGSMRWIYLYVTLTMEEITTEIPQRSSL